MINHFISYLLSLMLFLGFIKTYGQNNLLDNKPQDIEETEKKPRKTVILFSAGCNISSYFTEDGGWQLGYRIGMTINTKVSEAVFIMLPFAYVRINAFQKNVERKFYSGVYVDESYQDYYVYKLFRDWKISLAFFEFPVLLGYKVYQTNRYNISFTFGPGIAFAIKDISKQPTYTFTDEIIGTHNGEVFNSFNESDAYRYFKNSGLNLNTGIRFNVSRLYLDVMYTFYPYKIKEIKNLNTISLILSVDYE